MFKQITTPRRIKQNNIAKEITICPCPPAHQRNHTRLHPRQSPACCEFCWPSSSSATMFYDRSPTWYAPLWRRRHGNLAMSKTYPHGCEVGSSHWSAELPMAACPCPKVVAGVPSLPLMSGTPQPLVHLKEINHNPQISSSIIIIILIP